jgi:hypothetical protein
MEIQESDLFNKKFFPLIFHKMKEKEQAVQIIECKDENGYDVKYYIKLEIQNPNSTIKVIRRKVSLISGDDIDLQEVNDKINNKSEIFDNLRKTIKRKHEKNSEKVAKKPKTEIAGTSSSFD